MSRQKLLPILLAGAVTLPGLALRLSGATLAPPLMAVAAGSAILGASFLLLWACDAAQAEISQALALAVVALIAVLPEYSVDMYFTWMAGKLPNSEYAHYAVANMTGANRLLIGVAWAAIAGISWLRFRRPVTLDPSRSTELVFLGAATAYALMIPVKGNLAWYDGMVFLALYAGYIALAARRGCGHCEVEGPAEYIAGLPRMHRRLATLGLFIFAGSVILVNASAFCEGLVATGKLFHVNEFLLVQWAGPDCVRSAGIYRGPGIRLARTGGLGTRQSTVGQAQSVDTSGRNDPRRLRVLAPVARASHSYGGLPNGGDLAHSRTVASWPHTVSQPDNDRHGGRTALRFVCWPVDSAGSHRRAPQPAFGIEGEPGPSLVLDPLHHIRRRSLRAESRAVDLADPKVSKTGRPA